MITEWTELFNPANKGRSAILDVPNIGIKNSALALQRRGDLGYGNKGNMTRKEIDITIDALIVRKRKGRFRARRRDS